MEEQWDDGDRGSGGFIYGGVRDVAGWTNPGTQGVVISDGGAVLATGVYTGLDRDVAGDGQSAGGDRWGAKWRVDGGVWQDSGYTQTVSVGSHTVGFSEVVGLTNPGIQTVDDQSGGGGERTGNVYGADRFVAGDDESTGGDRCGGALASGWRGMARKWRDADGVRVGSQTVESARSWGGRSPGNRTVTINEGQTTNSSGTYTQPTGSLRVTIDPQGAIDAGARWRVDGGAWQASGVYADRDSGWVHTRCRSAR